MKIAIIGGGWIGCHLANKLKDEHDITLFEKNEKLFLETSYKNQNRLHLGYHYARNYETRNMCKNTFDLFISDYGFLTKTIEKNLYCLPKDGSIIDFKTYLEIFKANESECALDFKNIEGCVNTDERFIDFNAANVFFNDKLKDIIVNKNITKKDLNKMSKEYDLVIDSTNNQLKKQNKNSFYEPTITLLYEKNNDINFDAITLVDGEFFSIFPYSGNTYTLTDVKHTPIKKFKTLKNLLAFYSKNNNDFVLEKIKLIEAKVLKYYPKFKEDFKYHGYFLSTKSKIVSSSDSRYPIINKHNNIVNCFTGKIQGIYIIEDYIKNIINEN